MTTRPKHHLDDDGQPQNSLFNSRRRSDRDVAELLGLTKALLLDGKVTTQEAEYLANWMEAHPDARNVWPCNVVADRLCQIFRDNSITEEERVDLAELLQSLIGSESTAATGLDASTQLPLDVPPPPVTFAEATFVLTGKFAMGPRSACERLVRAAGGICEPSVTRRTRYLVIGTFGSRDWIQTSFGR